MWVLDPILQVYSHLLCVMIRQPRSDNNRDTSWWWSEFEEFMYSLSANALVWYFIKRRPDYPLVSTRTPLPRVGRTKDVMQVLFHKHVWLYSEYMPTLHWWSGASSMSHYAITITWGITSDIIIHHWSNAYELFTYCALLIYFTVATVTITTKLLLLLFLLLPLLPYYFATKYFAADTKLSTCGWIDNSNANTWEYSLAPLVSNQ